jgi:hypothetical protein
MLRASDALKLQKCQSAVRMMLGVARVRRVREKVRFERDELHACGRDRVLYTHQRIMDRLVLESAAVAVEMVRE